MKPIPYLNDVRSVLQDRYAREGWLPSPSHKWANWTDQRIRGVLERWPAAWFRNPLVLKVRESLEWELEMRRTRDMLEVVNRNLPARIGWGTARGKAL